MNAINRKNSYYHGMKVLFVDDDSAFINSLKRSLIDEPFSLFFASTGQEALALLAKEKINVVIADMKMPGMSGLTLLQKIKELYPFVVRLILTGYVDPTQILAAINTGEVYRFLVKTMVTDESFTRSIYESFDFFLLQQSQRELTTQRALLQQIVAGNPIPTFVINNKHKITYWNRACEVLTGIHADDVLNTTNHWKSFYHENRPLLADLVMMKNAEQAVARYYGDKYRRSPILQGTFEVEDFVSAVKPNGRWVLVSATPLLDEKSQIIGAIETIQDITVLKKTESYLQQINEKLEQRVAERTTALQKSNKKLNISLKEKELLLKEIHHRVKNNLQVVISLLRLQEHYLSDPDAIVALQETQSRVHSMALVHARLYRSADLNNIDFNDYITGLTKHLFSMYRAKCGDVWLEKRIEPISLNITKAVPCGMIINELISNSFKHAFPENRKGHIVLTMKQKKQKIYLSVSDDGIGFSNEIDFENTDSLGMQLVMQLVQQLEGNIQLYREKGTEFRVSFDNNVAMR